jgi:hypothetical protein
MISAISPGAQEFPFFSGVAVLFGAFLSCSRGCLVFTSEFSCLKRLAAVFEEFVAWPGKRFRGVHPATCIPEYWNIQNLYIHILQESALPNI